MTSNLLATAAPQSSDDALKILGTVRNLRTRAPVEAMLVQLHYVEPPSAPGEMPMSPRLIGSAVTGVDGQYVIGWMPGPWVMQILCLLANCSEAQVTMTVSLSAKDKPLLETAPAALGQAVVRWDLLVPVPQQAITTRQWAALGKRARAAGLLTLNRLVAQLTGTPANRSLFGDWTSVQRQNAVSELEVAFLDPRKKLASIAALPSWQELSAPGGLDAYKQSLGRAAHRADVSAALQEVALKLGAFPGLAAVDWQIDPSLFRRDPAAAITAHQQEHSGPTPQPSRIGLLFYPEIGYRDYLRTLWSSAITTVVYVQPHQLTEAQANQQLRNRFHQDFTTTDDASGPVNEILIAILTEILTAPPGIDFGFGIAAASIPARAGASARQYLDTLIALTGVNAQELSLRYRTDFTRPDGGPDSSPIWENIYTLQGFFRDSFQAVVDPAHIDPDVLGQPIVPDLLHGKAPFFLEFDEWLLLQQPVPYENYVQVRAVFHMDVSEESRTILKNLAAVPGGHQSEAKFHVGALAINDALVKAFGYFDSAEYLAAFDALSAIQGQLQSLLNDPNIGTPAAIAAEFAKRRGKAIHSLTDLYFPVDAYGDPGLLTMWQDRGFTYTANPGDHSIDDYFGFYTPKVACALVYLWVFALPTLLGQLLLALGRFAQAVRLLGRASYLLVGKASPAIEGAYGPYYLGGYPLYVAGDLAYTVETAALQGYPSFDADDSQYPTSSGADPFVAALVPGGLHPVERAYYRLQMGAAMLQWADTLFRSNDASSIMRARELYKGVYFLHGATPPINPQWDKPGGWGFFPLYLNPAKASQLARAELGFTQIAAGLNFFGYPNDFVPAQRYSVLKAAADAFAADARSAEQDFLNAMTQIENATIDNIKNTAMFVRAKLQMQIAQQQAAIANDQQAQANALIGQVNQQIQDLQKQIADHDSFTGQLGDYLGGMASLLKGAGDLISAGKTVSTEMGASAGGEGSLLGLSGGAAALSGYAAFAVASYMTLSSMADAANQRDTQLHTLTNQSLVSANAALDIARHQVTIAGLQQQVAQCDADLATNLLAFAQERYLNIEFWSYMAALFQRSMRRYLDFGARAGWLAQRALAYEQNTAISIVGLDYYPAQYSGAGGAEDLRLDLASLEAQHLAGLQEMVPLKLTHSLARDFPLQFAQLQKAGMCQFQTSDTKLQAAYPGMYGFRVLAATPRLVRRNAGAPMRGVLANGGVSQISRADGTLAVSLRPADGMPISDFDISTTDMNVFGLPGSTLMQFEGSGVETIWTLALPPAANPGGLDPLADVLVTLDLRARFSPSLFQATTGKPLAPSDKLIMMSAARLDPAGLLDLQKKSAGSIAFDLSILGLASNEKTRSLNHMFVTFVGAASGSTIVAKLETKTPAKSTAFQLASGVAHSNAPPITDAMSSAPPSPLNVLSGIEVNQEFVIHVSKPANPGIDFGKVADVILGIDYTATY